MVEGTWPALVNFEVLFYLAPRHLFSNENIIFQNTWRNSSHAVLPCTWLCGAAGLWPHPVGAAVWGGPEAEQGRLLPSLTWRGRFMPCSHHTGALLPSQGVAGLTCTVSPWTLGRGPVPSAPPCPLSLSAGQCSRCQAAAPRESSMSLKRGPCTLLLCTQSLA